MKPHLTYKTLIYCVLSAIVLTAPAGCRHHRIIDGRLDSTEAILAALAADSVDNTDIIGRADSIMALIESADTARMSDNQKARYTLLRAELDYKHYRDSFDLDGLNRALICFEDNGDRRRQMRTLFIRSVHEFDANDYIKSITSALRAERIAGELHDTLFLARINEHISFIYNRDGNRKSSKEHSYRAAQLYKQYGDDVLYQTCIIEYCLMMIDFKEYEQAIHTLDSIIPSISESDTLLQVYAKETLAQALLKTGRIEDTRSILEDIASLNISGAPNLNIRFALALNNNDTDSMRVLLEKILDSDKLEYHQGIKYQSIYQYNKAIGNIDTALLYHEKLYDIYLESMLTTLDQSIVKAESDFNAENARLNQHVAERKHSMFIMSLVILILVIVAVYFVYRWLSQKSKNEIRDKIATIDRLFDTIDSREQSIAELTQEIENKNTELVRLSRSLTEKKSAMTEMSEQVNRLYSEQYRMLNEIYDEYFNEGDADDSVKLAVYNRIRDQLVKMRDRKKIVQLQRSLNLYCDNIIKRLQADFPDMKNEDFTFLSLIIAGLAPKAVCMICNLTMGNFYVKRRRLRQRIEQSEAADIQTYLKYLNRLGD